MKIHASSLSRYCYYLNDAHDYYCCLPLNHLSSRISQQILTMNHLCHYDYCYFENSEQGSWGHYDYDDDGVNDFQNDVHQILILEMRLETRIDWMRETWIERPSVDPNDIQSF